MKNLKCLIVIIVSLVALLFISCGESLLNPATMAKSTSSTVKDVKTTNDDVFAEIQKNINMVIALKEKMANANSTNKTPTLDEVIKDIETVTKSYEDLASKKKEISNNFKNKIAVIGNMQKNVNQEIGILNDRANGYNKQLATLSTTTTDPETLRTRKIALTQAVVYVNGQVQLWKQFNSLESDITGEMIIVQQTIDNFLSMIDSSAILFREGLNLLKLQKDINSALSLFTVDLPTMQRLSQQMETSWGDLDYLVNSLTTLTMKIK